MIVSIILQVVIGIFILGILVFIHEFGHFFAAKLCGVRVISFSIGFGTPLLRKKYKDTEYRISAVPFGGYVHMAGEHPEDDHVGAPDEFTSKPIWQRAAVAVAGPAANIISSFLFLWLVFFIGVPHDLYLDSTVIGAVADSSTADLSGLVAGDCVKAINGTPVNTWEDVQQIFSRQEVEYKITFIRKGVEKEVVIEMPKNREGKISLNLTAGLMPSLPARVGSINQGSPAEKNGILPNDHILAIDNTTIHSWFQVSKMVRNFNPFLGPMHLIIQRNDSIIVISVEPSFSKKDNRYLLGIGVAQPETRIIRYSFFMAFPMAFKKSWEYTTMIFDVLSKIASRTVSPKQLAGPLGIIQMSGAVAFGSLITLLNFMALIGINLGILNLFPLIITDGGVLLFLILEAIRKKPLSLKTQLIVNRIAIAFFILLFIYVTKNDILRIPQLLGMIGK